MQTNISGINWAVTPQFSGVLLLMSAKVIPDVFKRESSTNLHSWSVTKSSALNKVLS
jgi:hypothetical protein